MPPLQPRVAVGVPLYGSIPTYVYYRHIKWFTESTYHTREIEGLLVSENCYLPWARRDIMNDAIKDKFTHLFFLDQDVVVPTGTVRRLLSHRKPIIGALYYLKVGNHAPCAGRLTDPLIDKQGWRPLEVKSELQKVEFLGLGATLIEVDVFRAMIEANGDTGVFDMNARTGEDIEFCRRATKAGFQAWVDTKIPTEHVGATPITSTYYRPVPEVTGGVALL